MAKNDSSSTKSNTLVFTTSRTTEMSWIFDPSSQQLTRIFANPGIYSCRIGDDKCENVQSMAKIHHGAFSDMDKKNMFNLDFYVSSKNKEVSPRQEGSDQIEDMNDDGNNYFYSVRQSDHRHSANDINSSWDIMRANLDSDGVPSYETYFKTLSVFDWNECAFDCCPFSEKHDRHDWAYMHAYARGIPRAFAVDENTGHIFISWEGFYKNCDPAAHFSVPPMLEWTIGISRLKTQAEDPSCILAKDENGNPRPYNYLENNFVRCTVPVSVLAMETRGRNLQLPHGGLTVIPAAKEAPAPGVKPRRTFLLSVMEPGKGTHLWAIPENGDATENKYMRQQLSTTRLEILKIYQQGIKNGGTIRVHYNQKSGRPDHLCRTVFDMGIRCMPIDVTEDDQSTYVTVIGDEETYLTQEQVASFCVIGPDVFESWKKEPDFHLKTRLVSGLDVVWNEEDGTPEKIYFGCSGYESAGKLGSVQKNGENLIEEVPGAHAGAVVFLPHELDVSTVRIPLKGEEESSSSILNKIPTSDLIGVAISVSLLVIVVALYAFYKKRSPSRTGCTNTSCDKDSNGRPRGLPVSYMELPIIDSSSSSSSAELSSSSNESWCDE